MKIELTWRDVAVRVLLVVVSVGIIVWFMPRDNRVNFKIEQGKPWRYADLTAPFDFPIYKSEAAVTAEQDSVLRDYEPYYVLRKEVGNDKVREFMKVYGKSDRLPADFRIMVVNRLAKLYEQGIVDTKSPLIYSSDSTCMLRLIDEKTVTSVAGQAMLTPVQAYEQLMGDSSLQMHRDVLQMLNMNEFLVPNVVYDRERSETSRQDLISSVPRASGMAQRGQKIIDRGTIVDEQMFLVLESFLKESERRHEDESQFITTTILGELLYVLLLVSGFTVFLGNYRAFYFDKLRSVGMIYSLIVLFSVITSLLVSHNLLHVFLIPFVMVPIFIRVFMDSRTAFMAHTVLVLICACMLQHPLEFIAVEMAAGLTAILSMRELSSRSQLFLTAALVTAASCLMCLGIDLIKVSDFSGIDVSAYKYLTVCGFIIFFTYSLLLIFEKLFGFTSNITLIELSDMNKELLRKMSEVAPGTFQHSIQVGNLAVEIARKIGGNAQLVRTGALYHDIGKTVNPVYFTENQSGGINPHEQLSCIESASMIISHVTEGLKLADRYNLPEVIKNFIATHHGQGKAKFFYVKWKNEHPDEDVDDLLFTYPGPNPFTKEQAILMMADAIEAASRSLPEYTEQAIRQLVNRIVDSMVDDGYFRECPITYRDIAYSKTVLIEKLKTIYHTRVAYPELKK